MIEYDCYAYSQTIELLGLYEQVKSKIEQNIPNVGEEDLIVARDNLINYIKNEYGDIYKKLKIDLYVNPTTKKIIFPNIHRLNSNYILFLKSQMFDKMKSSDNNSDSLALYNYKIEMYNVLFNDILVNFYNTYYCDYFAVGNSCKPKLYGIAKIMGGKRTRRKRNRYKKLI